MDSHNQTIGVLGTLEDITETMNLQKKLKSSEEKYRNLIEFTNTAYVIMNPELQILECNKTFAKLMGYENEEDVLNKNPRIWVDIKSIETFDNAFDRVLNGIPFNDIEIRFQLENNSYIYTSINASTIENGERKIFCLIRDITDRKQKDLKKFIQKEKQKDRIKQNIMEIQDQLRKIRT